MNLSSLSHFFYPISLLLLLLLFTLSYLQTPNPPKSSPNLLLTNPNPHKISLLPTPNHPLDPLTISEITSIRTTILSLPLFSPSPSSLVFHSLSLDPPDKSSVISWSAGDPLPPRRASTIVRFNGETHSLSIDIAAGEVSFLANPASGFPTMTIEDMVSSASAPLSDPRFNRSIIARGVKTSDLACLPVSSGWFGREIEERRRLIKVQCYSIEGTANFYMRPIEGLTVLVDMDTKEVVEITDRGMDIPIPKGEGTDYRYEKDGSEENGGGRRRKRLLKPISIEQPEGPSFEVFDGHR